MGPGGEQGRWVVVDDLPTLPPITKEEVDLFQGYFGPILDDLLRDFE